MDNENDNDMILLFQLEDKRNDANIYYFFFEIVQGLVDHLSQVSRERFDACSIYLSQTFQEYELLSFGRVDCYTDLSTFCGSFIYLLRSHEIYFGNLNIFSSFLIYFSANLI